MGHVDNHRIFKNGELMERVLKIFEYQLFNVDDLNIALEEKKKLYDQKKAAQAASIEIKKENEPTKVKKENDDGDTDGDEDGNLALIQRQKAREEAQYRLIDKNDLIIGQQIKLLLYKFKDYGRVQQIISNFESNQIALTAQQIVEFDTIKEDFKNMQNDIGLNENHSKSNFSILSHGSANSHSHSRQGDHLRHCDFNALPNFNLSTTNAFGLKF